MRLIILDTETTGLSPAEGRIVEIAAVEMLDGKLTGREFHHLLNPEHPMSEEITEITGINDAMVAGKPGGLKSEVQHRWLIFNEW